MSDFHSSLYIYFKVVIDPTEEYENDSRKIASDIIEDVITDMINEMYISQKIAGDIINDIIENEVIPLFKETEETMWFCPICARFDASNGTVDQDVVKRHIGKT